MRVWIRHCVGVRGMCEGVPVAYDQHMNIVLRDVVEHYTPFRTVANGGIEGSRKKKKKKKKTQAHVEPKDVQSPVESGSKNDHSSMLVTTESSNKEHVTSIVGSATNVPEGLTRQLKQLFIRGDNVLMVASMSAPQSGDSATT